MSTSPQGAVAGVFTSPEQARLAVDELRAAGFREEDIGLATGPEGDGQEPGCRSKEGITVGTGAGVGLLAGGAIGGLAAGALPGLLAGAVAGALLGGLTDLGIPEDAACFYRDHWQAGRTVVTVRAGSRADEAAELLRRHGAQEVRSWTAGEAPGRPREEKTSW